MANRGRVFPSAEEGRHVGVERILDRCVFDRALRAFVGVVLLGAVCGVLIRSASADGPPNIVFVLADDLGIGDLGFAAQLERAAAGLPAIQTPNIDTLAGQGMRLNNMYSGATVCSPARASLLTGFSQAHLMADRADHTTGLRAGDEDRTWAQLLQDAGYETGMYGKWHLAGIGTDQAVTDVQKLPTQKGIRRSLWHAVGGVPQLGFV